MFKHDFKITEQKNWIPLQGPIIYKLEILLKRHGIEYYVPINYTEVPDEAPCFCEFRGRLIKREIGYVYINLDPEEVTQVCEQLFQIKEYEI